MRFFILQKFFYTKIPYDLKYEIVENFVKKINTGEIKWKYIFWYDRKAKMATVIFSIGNKRKSYHIPPAIRDKIKNNL